jgi:DNA-directed RNA polymerase subunit RPC12/RpoP
MNGFDRADQMVGICSGLMPCVVVIVIIAFFVFVIRRGNKPSTKSQGITALPVETRVCTNCGKSFIASPDQVEVVENSTRKQFTCPHCKTKVAYTE